MVLMFCTLKYSAVDSTASSARRLVDGISASTIRANGFVGVLWAIPWESYRMGVSRFGVSLCPSNQLLTAA